MEVVLPMHSLINVHELRISNNKTKQAKQIAKIVEVIKVVLPMHIHRPSQKYIYSCTHNIIGNVNRCTCTF